MPTLQDVGNFKYYIYDLILKEKQLKNEITKSPIELIIEQLAVKENLKKGKVYILKSGTGSGKSTLFLASLYEIAQKNILCTQPRIVLAKENTEAVAKFYPKFIKGYNIGFNAGGMSIQVNIGVKSLKFITTQIISNIIQNNPQDLFKYQYIALDEVHEEDQQMIESLFFVKQFITENQDKPDCPIFIIMSATLQFQKYIDYFNLEINWYDIADVKGLGLPYTVQLKYLKQFETPFLKQNNLLNKKYTIINSIMTAFDEMGGRVMEETVSALYQYVKKKQIPFKILGFTYSSADVQTQSKNYELYQREDQENVVKIIVSTTLLQAGATIPNLFLVLDTAMQNKPIFYPFTTLNPLPIITFPVSQDTIQQRKGRVGRQSEGIYYGLYPENVKFIPFDYSPFQIQQNITILMFSYIQTQIKNKTIPQIINEPEYCCLEKIDTINQLTLEVSLVSYHKMQKMGFIYQNKRISLRFYLLLKHNFIDFIEFICKYNELTVYETSLIQYMYTRNLKLQGMVKYSKGQIIQYLINEQWNYFDEASLIDCFVFIWDYIVTHLIWPFDQTQINRKEQSEKAKIVCDILDILL